MKKNQQCAIILDLCPDIVSNPVTRLIREIRCVLESGSEVHKIGLEWHSMVGERRFVFKKNPSAEYLQELIDLPKDLDRHIEAVNHLRRNISKVSGNFNPYRQLAVVKPDPPCKACGKNDYIDCGTHFTCKSCAVTRTKYERGLDFRNIKERTQAEGSNSSNWHTLDPLLSDASNRQTVIGVAPGVAKGAKPGDKPVSVRNMNAWNKRLYNNKSEIDNQIVKAKICIEDLCDDLGLHAAVASKAHLTFCKFIRHMRKMPRENEVIAACMFEALPPEPKIYRKRKKRYLTPYNDTKKKRLRFTKFH